LDYIKDYTGRFDDTTWISWDKYKSIQQTETGLLGPAGILRNISSIPMYYVVKLGLW